MTFAGVAETFEVIIVGRPLYIEDYFHVEMQVVVVLNWVDS